MFEEKINQFSEYELSEFKRIANSILGHKYIMELEYDVKSEQMLRNPDYEFVVSYWDEFSEWFEYGGFTLENDPSFRTIYVTSEFADTHYRFPILTTFFLYILRLLYIEQHSAVNLYKQVSVTRASLVSKLYEFDSNRKSPAKVTESLKQLAKWNVICKKSGKWDDPDAEFIIYPTVNMILNNQNLADVKNYIDDKNFVDIDEEAEGEEALDEEA